MKILNMIDTSGGISAEAFESAKFDIVHQLSEENEVAIGCFDMELHNFKEVKTVDDIKKYQMDGDGGTLLQRPLKDAIDRFGTPHRIVIFSDFFLCDVSYEYLNSLTDAGVELVLVKIGDNDCVWDIVDIPIATILKQGE